MQNLVNHRLTDNPAELHEQFVSARPFRHIAIDGFLDEAFARSLLDSFPAFDEKLAINEDDEVGGKAVQEKLSALGPAWQQLDKRVQGEECRAWISEITAGLASSDRSDWFETRSNDTGTVGSRSVSVRRARCDLAISSTIASPRPLPVVPFPGRR